LTFYIENLIKANKITTPRFFGHARKIQIELLTRDRSSNLKLEKGSVIELKNEWVPMQFIEITKTPFVSIVICTYNRKKLLKECLNSIFAMD